MTTALDRIRIEPSWKVALAEGFLAPEFAGLREFLLAERDRGQVVYPPGSQIFRAFDSTPFDRVKVVILGQDPYHGPSQANGLAFSVNHGVPLPPSLRNMYQELHEDLGIPPASTGDLGPWARQGVLLLNATLTVRAGEATSHQGRGWEALTDLAIRHLAQRREFLVFILWGRSARAKRDLIDQRHAILESAHPSPLSAHGGFFGSRPFSRANQLLEAHGMAPIDWRIP